MKEREIEPGTPEINKKYSIVVDRKGPYLVYGHPLLKQQFIVQNDEGSSWSYRDGVEYDMNDEPTALCRCGASANKPYCDGAHLNTNWDPSLTADNIPLLKDADVVDGPTLELTDNEKYCAFARFCGIIITIIIVEKTGFVQSQTVKKLPSREFRREETWERKPSGRPFAFDCPPQRQDRRLIRTFLTS